MVENKATNCEYLVSDRICKAIVEVEEGKATRKKWCKNKQKDLCCYLCDNKDSCDISCNYIGSPSKKEEPKYWKYDAKYLGGHAAFASDANGKLYLHPMPDGKVVFESKKVNIEIPLSKIKNSKIITEKEIRARRVLLTGIIGLAWRKKHKIIVIDFEDALGGVQSPLFEADKMEEAASNLYNMRMKTASKA